MNPVMEVEKSARLWQLARWPLFIFIALVVVVTLVVVLALWIRSIKIHNTVLETARKASVGTLQYYLEADQTLDELLESHPERSDVLSASAWARVYGAHMYGMPAREHLEEIQGLLSGIKDEKGVHDLFWAARALTMVMKNETDGALEITREKTKEYKKSNELKYVHALALRAANNDVEAAIELELLHSRKKPYVPAMLELAGLKASSGNLDASLKVLLEVLDMQPDNIIALVETTHIEIRKGGKSLDIAEEMIKKFQGKLDGAPPAVYARGHLAVGRLHIERKNYAKAVAPLEKAYEREPGDHGIIHSLAFAYRMNRQPLSAVKILGKAGDPQHLPTEVLRETAESNLMLLRTRKADEAVQVLLRRPDADAPRAHFMAGHIAAHCRKFDKAASHFEAAGNYPGAGVFQALYLGKSGNLRDCKRKLRKLDLKHDDQCADLLFDWYHRKGDRAVEDGEDLKACPLEVQLRLVEEAARFSRIPKLLEGCEQCSGMPLFLYFGAVSALRTMGRKVAREELEKIMKLAPESLQLLSDVIAAYTAMGLHDEALRVAQYCYEKNPDAPEAFALLASSARGAQKLEKSEEAVREGLKKFPEEPSILVAQAHMLVDKNENEEARSILEKAVEKADAGKTLADAAVLLADVLFKIGDDKEADSVLLDAARTLERSYDPSLSIDVYARLVASKRRQGGKKNRRKSRGLFLGTSKKNYPSARLQFEGALTYLAEGNGEDAVEKLSKSISIDPTFKPAYLKLAELGALSKTQRMNFEKIFDEKLE